MENPIQFLLDLFEANLTKEAIISKDQIFTYKDLIDKYNFWKTLIAENVIPPSSLVVIKSDYTFESISLFLALISEKCIVVPIVSDLDEIASGKINLSKAEYLIKISGDKFELKNTGLSPDHQLIHQLKTDQSPGLILFSSGTTGKSKAAVHNLNNLFSKYRQKRKDFRTIAFMMYDHIGGVDTLFYSLSNASTIIIADDRNPEYICSLVQKYKVEVLPVTPSFINLLLISKIYMDYDLSSLKYITYGTEVMPKETLNIVTAIFPDVLFLQKYGTTEVGTLRSKSKGRDSLWVKLGGEGYQTRIIDGILQIKSDSAMLGYLNAPSPFTEDGWYITGDLVEEDGEWYRILGRNSDIINVGGEKVIPAEVENIILKTEGCLEATVFGEKHQIMGHIVCAEVNVSNAVTDEKDMIRRIKRTCAEHLQSYKIPVKIKVTHEWQYTDRFKKKGVVND